MGLFSFFFFYFSLVLTSQFFFLWSNSMLPEPKNPKCPHQHVGVPLLQGAQPPSSPWDNSCILKVWLSSRHHQTSRRLTFNLHKTPRLHFRFLELLPTCHTTLLPRGLWVYIISCRLTEVPMSLVSSIYNNCNGLFRPKLQKSLGGSISL